MLCMPCRVCRHIPAHAAPSGRSPRSAACHTPCRPPLAQALLAAAPVETTAALMGLCLRDPADPGAWVASMADFTHLYTDR